jgi:putative addiction module killer protein
MTVVNTILRSHVFDTWFSKLRDSKVKARVLTRMDAAAYGNFGDWKSVSSGICEMRIDVGPGYRIYYTRRGMTVYLLLLGGDKSSSNATSRMPCRWQAIWIRSEA